MTPTPNSPHCDCVLKCQQRIGHICRYEGELTCSACGKRICRRHSRLSFVELVNLFSEGHIVPDWRDRLHRSLCVTCHRLELWTGKQAGEVSDDERRKFLETPDGAPFIGVWEMKRWR